jgi:hypothetical protein
VPDAWVSGKTRWLMADDYKRSFLVDLEILQYLSVVLTEKTMII